MPQMDSNPPEIAVLREDIDSNRASLSSTGTTDTLTMVSSAQEEQEDPGQDIENPRDTDVLGGRGGKALRHPGNQTYRRLVTLNKGLYATCLKSEKLKISKSIVAAIRDQNGRFLEKKRKSDKWYDIGDKKAVEKTSQALREDQPKTKKIIQELGGGAVGAQALLESQLAEERLQAQTRLSASGVLGGITGGAMQAANSMSGAVPGNLLDMQYPSMDANELAAAAGFPPMDSHHMSGRFLQPMSPDALSQLPHERQFSLSDVDLPYEAGGGDGPPPMPPIGMRNVSMELYKMGLSEPPIDEEDEKKLHPQSRSYEEEQEGDDVMATAVRLRPSLTKKGSAVREELGMASGQMSSMSLMSDFSTMSLEEDSKRINSLVREFGLDPASSLTPKNSLTQQSSGRMDRRKMFAHTKAKLPASELSDGMPEIHLVESNNTAISRMSAVAMAAAGEDGRLDSFKVPSVTNSKVGDVVCESRRSIMSGLSRISDNSEVQSIFSDLSRKIGNVSTRSMAMDDISLMDGAPDDGPDSRVQTPTLSAPKPSLTMDYEFGM